MGYGTNLLTSCSLKAGNTQGRDERRKDIKVAFSDLGLLLPDSRLGPVYQQGGNSKSFPEGITMALHQ